MFILAFFAQRLDLCFFSSQSDCTVTISIYSIFVRHLGHLRKLSINIQIVKLLIRYSNSIFCF